jgi:predicted dehydrogenase
MINATIVGLGWWGKHIVHSLQDSGTIRIVRGVDVNPDAARDFASQHGVSLTADLRDALDDAQIHAVILATPHSLHEAQILRAAAAGKHVFCEKPLALTRASAERAIVACEEAGVVLGVGHERRFEPAMVEIKRLINSGELGTIMHVEANFSHDRLGHVDPHDWHASTVEAPAAGMTAMGIHLTDTYIHMLGPVEKVFAQSAKRVVASDSGDVIAVHLTFTSGVTGYLNAILVTPLFMRFQVFGAEGWVEARDTAHPEMGGVTYLTLCTRDGAPQTREYNSINTVRANLEAFAEAVGGGAPYPFTREEKLHNIAILEAIVTSVATGEAVRVS